MNPEGEAAGAPLSDERAFPFLTCLRGGQGREKGPQGAGTGKSGEDHGFPGPPDPLTENDVQEDPVQTFISALDQLLIESGLEMHGESMNADVELRRRGTGQLIGYWPSYVTKEGFRDLR